MSPEKQPQTLISIERVVAFVLGPAVIAGSAWLSSWLATKVGVKVSSEEITGIAAAGGLGAAGLVWKWLDGRSKHTLATKVETLTRDATNIASTAGVSPEMQKNIIHIAEEDLQKWAEKIVHGTVGVIHNAEQALPQPTQAPEPIPPAIHDPAPPTPVPAVPPLTPGVPPGPAAPVESGSGPMPPTQ